MFKKRLHYAAAAIALSAALTGVAEAAAPPPVPTNVLPPPTVSLGSVGGVTIGANGVDAFYGSIDPFYGSIDAFWGSLDPFFGSLDPFYGSLDPFFGSLDPFWGSLDPFYGSLDPFYGSLDAFYGSLDAFQDSLGAYWGSLDPFYGSLDPFYGSLDPFWGSLDPFFGSLDPFTGNAANVSFDVGFGLLLRQAKDAFGEIIEEETGKSFQRAFWHPFVKKHNLAQYAGPDAVAIDRATLGAILLDFNDQLNHLLPIDAVDHWMVAANWSPRIAGEAFWGENVTIGILDTLTRDVDLIGGEFVGTRGYRIEDQTHGAGVLSLIAAAHDGEGVMGVSPNVDVLQANPFDETMTASWVDVQMGLRALGADGASVINMSLGAAGYTLHQDWAYQVFASRKVMEDTAKAVFVKAAGNSGVAQNEDINWTTAQRAAGQAGVVSPHNRLIIVGSLSTTGEISSFSNRPGTGCLTINGDCYDGYRLMDRFIVAPGELLLVSDGAGGVSRASGTSFAAPLVTGTIALIQNRWSWMKEFPVETAEVVLRSATDLGAPGTDEIYGRGLLNIEAAMSPLNRSALIVSSGLGSQPLYGSGLTDDAQSLLGAEATVTAIEVIGSTFRDFQVKLSDLNLATEDTSTTAAAQSEQELQTSLSSTPTLPTGGSTGGALKKGKKFASFTNGLDLGRVGIGDADSAWTANFAATAREPGEFAAPDAVPFQVGATFRNNESGLTLMLGEGQSMFAFNGGGQFSMLSDHELSTGGVNPFLGLASGGLYAGAGLPVSERMTVGFGFTQDEDRNVFADPNTGEIRRSFDLVDDYSAAAMTMNVAYALSPAVDVSASYTYLDEATGFLGVQGAGAFGLAGGAATDALTLGADVRTIAGVDLSMSATLGRSRAATFDGSLLSIDDGVTSTAFQIAAGKAGVFASDDVVRVSFAQPLHVEAGAIEMTTLQVVDRSTGELAQVVDRIGLDGASRRYVSEVLYGTPTLDGLASLNAFTRVEINNRDFGFEQTVYSGGVRLNVGF